MPSVCAAAPVFPVTSVHTGLGGLFGGRVGGLGGFCAGLEGIDLRHQPSAGRSNRLFFGPHVGVLAAQVGELAGDPWAASAWRSSSAIWSSSLLHEVATSATALRARCSSLDGRSSGRPSLGR